MNRQVVSVSQNAVIEAESAILGCDRCTPGAGMPFWQVLDNLRIYQGDEVIYILPVLACCPSCRAPIDEITRVEPRVAVNTGSVKDPMLRSKA